MTDESTRSLITLGMWLELLQVAVICAMLILLFLVAFKVAAVLAELIRSVNVASNKSEEEVLVQEPVSSDPHVREVSCAAEQEGPTERSSTAHRAPEENSSSKRSTGSKRRATAGWKDASGRTQGGDHYHVGDATRSLMNRVRGKSVERSCESGHVRFKFESEDHFCVRTMLVTYTDPAGDIVEWTGSGYSACCDVPSLAVDIKVTFEVVTPFAKSVVWEVDRSKASKPWRMPYKQEEFLYDAPMPTLFMLRGTSRHCYVDRESNLTD